MNKLLKCQWPNCKDQSDIIYLEHGLCDKHWVKFCDLELKVAQKKLGIKEQK